MRIPQVLCRQGRLGVQAGTEFCDGDFQREVASGKLSSNSLDAFTCLGLAGVCAETVVYGRSEGGLADIAQLDSLLRRINFNQAKADDQVNKVAVCRIQCQAEGARGFEGSHDGVTNALGLFHCAGAMVGHQRCRAAEAACRCPCRTHESHASRKERC